MKPIYKPKGAADVFGDWDAARYLKAVLEKLGPVHPVNIPDFRAILKKAMDDGIGKDFFCDYCEGYGYRCRNCIVAEWIEENDG